MLLKGNAPDLSVEIDADLIDLQDYKFVPGQQVEMYYKKFDRLTYCTVEQVLDEMI